MDNRFGIKDLLVTVLLLGVLVSIWLAMKQDDRQWELLQSVQGRLEQQSQVLNRLNDLLERGVTLATPRSTPGDTPRSVPGSATVPGIENDVDSHAPAVSKSASDTSSSVTASLSGTNNGKSVDPFYRIRRAQSQADFAQGDWFIDAFGVAVGKLTPARIVGYLRSADREPGAPVPSPARSTDA